MLAEISLVRMLLLGGDALGCLCSFLLVWGLSSHQSCPVYSLLQQGCLHNPVLKPILGLSLAGRTQAVGVAVFSLALPKIGSFSMFSTGVITDRWMAASFLQSRWKP